VDQSTFTNLTGVTLSSSQSARFETVAEFTDEMIAELLGWPLDPNDWQNQYTEIGKLPDDWTSPDFTEENLLPPDTVQGKTRLYRWEEYDKYLFIDPAVKIYAVKLVKDGITFRTFKSKHYRVDFVNGSPSYARYIELHRSWIPGHFWSILWAQLPDLPFERRRNVQVAIDADWGFSDLPTSIERVWAEQIAYEMDLKRDIKSESMLSHSYSKAARDTPVMKYASTLAKYVGPNGTAMRPGVVV
jgi:hypothetical protein